jgi:major membrane immunogen (membrane-anchored lipoprotein)
VLKTLNRASLSLPQDQLKQFRAWYEKFDANKWDEQIDQDVKDGRLDAIAEAALAEYKSGKARKL